MRSSSAQNRVNGAAASAGTTRDLAVSRRREPRAISVDSSR